MSNNIVLATDSDREHLMTLYKEQVGREFCAWDEDYPSTETIDFDLSRDALFVMKMINCAGCRIAAVLYFPWMVKMKAPIYHYI